MSLPVSLCHWGAFEADVRAGRLNATRPWPGSGADPEMIGALPELVYSDKRILRPHIRESWLRLGHRAGGSGRGSDKMMPVDWDTALNLVAAEIARVHDQYGHDALFAGSYGWSSAGRFHHARSQVRRFFGALGGFIDQTGNYSWGAAQIILQEVLGSNDAVSGAATAWDSIAGNTDLLVAFGGLNPKNWKVTSGGAGSHHMPDHVRRAAAKGTHFVVLSPFADDIPDGLEATWIAPRPGTDTAIMLALAAEMVARGRADRGFLERFTSGADRFLAYLAGDKDGVPKSLAWAAEIADVDEEALWQLADRLEQGRVMLTASWSLQRARYGEMTYWALIGLAAVLGQIGQPGGGFTFGYGSLNAVGEGAIKGLVPSLPNCSNDAGTTIPVARIADMLERPGETIPFRGSRVRLPHARLIYWAGGNPFHHAQDLFRLQRLWQRPETIIVHEQVWTATAQRADIVLPATTSLERCDIGGSSRDRHVFYMPKLIEPVGEARSDFDIFRALSDRLGVAERYAENRDEAAWLAHLWGDRRRAAQARGIEAPRFDELKRRNVWSVPKPDRPEILLEAFRRDPDGAPLATPSGRIELTSSRIAGYNLVDLPPHPAWLDPWEDEANPGGFPLLSRQPRRFLHSQLAGTSLAGEPELLMHCDDARDQGFIDGMPVKVRSATGSTQMTLRTTSRCRRGVLAAENGPWFQGRDGLDPGGNPNAVTSDIATSSLSQATAAQTCRVWVEAV